jgi:hypothetical protein
MSIAGPARVAYTGGMVPWWTIAAVALAKTPAKAELSRLDDELNHLARDNAWGGVERTYVSMLQVAAKAGMELTHEEHVLGAQAAEARGDVRATWERLRKAQAVAPDEPTQEWIARLEVTHGMVSIRVSPLVRGPVTLEVLDPPDPDALKTIEAARAELSDRRRFDGLLPLGRYRIGSLKFEIDGGPRQDLVVNPGPADEAPEGALVRIPATGAAGDRFEADLQGALVALRELEGVASVGVTTPPQTLTYVDIDPDQLDALGLTATSVGQAVRDQLGLLDTYVAVRPTTLAIRDPSADLGTVNLTLSDGRIVPLTAVGTARTGPDDTAPPAGVWVEVAPGADAEAVRGAASEVLRRSASLYFGP